MFHSFLKENVVIAYNKCNLKSKLKKSSLSTYIEVFKELIYKMIEIARSDGFFFHTSVVCFFCRRRKTHP
jgi:hypothetical protein